MRPYEINSIKDINLTDLDGKALRTIGRTIARYRDGASSKRFIIKKGDKVHACLDIEEFIYYKYRNEPIYTLEFYDISA